MNHQDTPHPPPSTPRSRRGGYIVGPVFLLLAAWFLFGTEDPNPPLGGTPPFDKALLSTDPVRKAMGQPPRTTIGGFSRTCMECHRIFDAAAKPEKELRQHENIELEHSPAMDCQTCHHPEDRNYLRLADGSKLPYTEVVTLCGECHASRFRDWTIGAHGRVDGYWNPDLGKPRKLKCTECHDPHTPLSPVLDPVIPLPGPHTLRLIPSPPKATMEHERTEKDPLQKALHRTHAAPKSGVAEEDGR